MIAFVYAIFEFIMLLVWRGIARECFCVLTRILYDSECFVFVSKIMRIIPTNA